METDNLNSTVPPVENQLSSLQKDKNNLPIIDLICSILILAIGLYVAGSGLYIALFEANGTDVWYYSPGMFPIMIGACLMIFALLLFFKKRKEGARLKNIHFENLRALLKEKTTYRLLLAIALFSAYVFLLIGHIPFVAATFIYLAVTMIVFRRDGFPIWKLLLISAITTAFIYVFFGIIAAVPLP
jgi:cell division protein FtsW (lipid II flippase)